MKMLRESDVRDRAERSGLSVGCILDSELGECVVRVKVDGAYIGFMSHSEFDQWRSQK